MLLPIATYTIVVEVSKGNFSPISMVSCASYNLWFLWAVFFLSLVTLALTKLPEKIQMGRGILLYISMFCIPNWRMSPNIIFMYPFFLLGFYFNKYKLFDILFHRHLFKATIITGALYIVLYLIFDKETYIYWSGYSIVGKGWHQLGVDIQRTITGICGSLFVICLLRMTFGYYHTLFIKFLLYLGQNTLQLYVISMFPVFIKTVGYFSDGKVNYVLTFVSFFVIVAVSTAIIELIKCNKYTNLIFFGKSLKKTS